MATQREAQTDDERSLCRVACLGNLKRLMELLDKGVFVDVFVCSTLREDFLLNRNKNKERRNVIFGLSVSDKFLFYSDGPLLL
jgi:hypothetical protein